MDVFLNRGPLEPALRATMRANMLYGQFRARACRAFDLPGNPAKYRIFADQTPCCSKDPVLYPREVLLMSPETHVRLTFDYCGVHAGNSQRPSKFVDVPTHCCEIM